MARALTPQEKLRYPWASRIVDYMPIGIWRKVAVAAGAGGLALYALGILGIYFFSPYLLIENGLPVGVAEYIVMVPAFAAMAFGLVVGCVTAVTALLHRARPALIWSVGAMLPGLVIGVITLLAG
jgi:hypothetical protein